MDTLVHGWDVYVSFWELFWQTNNHLFVVGAVDLACTLAVFTASFITGNSSLYDPYWSLAPPLIVFGFGSGAGDWSTRQWILVLAVWVWAVRLTLNWWSRWEGMSHQDWRYLDIARATGPLYWPVSLLGIHLFPTLLVFLGCVPMYFTMHPTAAHGYVSRDLNVWDVLALATFVVAIGLEWGADATMNAFLKRAAAARGKDREDRPVCREGLWGLSRHPNYLGEILFWVAVYLSAIGALHAADNVYGVNVDYITNIGEDVPERHGHKLLTTGQLKACLATGVVSMLLLFYVVSIPMMERRQLARRGEAYAEYCRRVSKLIPFLPF